MDSIILMIKTTIKAKFMPIWRKLRMWITPTYFKAKVLVKIREFITNLFSVKPQDKKDYYGIGNWLVSKRLAFAVVILMGFAAVAYIILMAPGGLFDAAAVPTYGYRSIPLKFYSGTVQITAKGDYIAYVGNVDSGAAVGSGVLYDEDGNMVYSGAFSDNMFNGTGTQYYPGGQSQYIGAFTDNYFNGTGTYYWGNGNPQYTGSYVMGVRSGEGVLSNSTGANIYEGTFQSDDIVYSALLEKPTSQVATMYMGSNEIYSSDSEYCTVMTEIDAMYAADDGSNSLEEEWTVSQVFVLKQSLCMDSKTLTTISDLRSYFGEPMYSGTGWVNMAEAVAMNALAQTNNRLLSTVEITTTATFDDVYSVSSYDKTQQVYLYSFERDGLIYTFYTGAQTDTTFGMYAIEMG